MRTRPTFAATYGFAITTTDDTGPDGGAVEDPNVGMLAEMTPAEQDAWHDALWGAPEPIPEGGDIAPPRFGGDAMNPEGDR